MNCFDFKSTINSLVLALLLEDGLPNMEQYNKQHVKEAFDTALLNLSRTSVQIRQGDQGTP